MKKNIAVIDDDLSCLHLAKKLLTNYGHEAITFQSLESIESYLKSNKKKPSEMFDLIISDVRMPESNGITVVKRLKKQDPNARVLLMTSFTQKEMALEALEVGALDYIHKPHDNPPVFNMVIHKWLYHPKLKDKIDHVVRPHFFLCQSESLNHIIDLVDKVARTHVNIFVQGETGTGKEILARYIHETSGISGPFVAINCAAIPKELIESELFGHEKGSFTGATEQKMGLIEKANNGTLFLDEIGDMNFNLQSRLLRVLQDKKIRRVGGREEINVNSRVICATHKDLRKKVRSGDFREDLFFRLNVIEINIPPLRERDDIWALTKFLFEKLKKKHQINDAYLDPSVKNELKQYSWPGNIRELENTLERTLLLSDTDIIGTLNVVYNEFDSSPKSKNSKSRSLVIPECASLRDVEMQYIYYVLKKHDYNKTKAANELKIGLRTLYRKLEDEKDSNFKINNRIDIRKQLNFL